MDSLSVALYGVGNVGRGLVRETLHAPFKYVVIADRSGVIAKRDGFNEEELKAIADSKERGGSLKDHRFIGDTFDDSMHLILGKYRPDVLVDVSVAQSYGTLLYALSNGIHVIGSNKKPYSDTTFSQYQLLFKTAEQEKRILDNRTVVSANLGVLPRVAEFVDTGGISRIEGCLSGTKAYISHRINQFSRSFLFIRKYVPFSQALSEARELNYTESDERDDLLWIDFRRKAVIIGRRVGIPLEIGMIKVEDYIPRELLELPLEEFRRRLPEIDKRIELAVRRTQKRRCMYRAMGTLDFDRKEYTIGFKEIPKYHPQATVQGCFNKVTIYPRAWKGESLTIEGPGAGLFPTVQGLIAGLIDILRIENMSK